MAACTECKGVVWHGDACAGCGNTRESSEVESVNEDVVDLQVTLPGLDGSEVSNEKEVDTNPKGKVEAKKG